MLVTSLTALALAALGAHAAKFPKVEKRAVPVPAPVKDYKVIKSPTGVTIRYKEPGEAGVCETTPGVKSYSGYVDLGADKHAFFWFFESRHDPANDPITFWTNGGPGSDSQIGLFEEFGPCSITPNLTSVINPYSWSEASNLFFLSQPYGVGFSYRGEEIGSINQTTGVFAPPSAENPPNGRFPVTNPTSIPTTDTAAVAAWHILQGFYSALPQLDSKVNELKFNLWTESYGGHYGPAFFNYFYEQNQLIAEGKQKGHHVNMYSLGIINGIINEYIQAPYYPVQAVNNTYGIKAYNDTVLDYVNFALNMPNGCLQQIQECYEYDENSIAGKAVCTEAENMCRDNVEGPYYAFSGRGVYDIRHPYNDPTPPSYFESYLNLAHVQQAIGVNLNYTDANNNVYYAFQQTGDFVYPNFLEDLERIINNGVRVALFYGDADYICNWFGGQAVSLAVNYTHAAQFRAAGYTPFVVDGTEYGEVRQYGNFSFTRIYESGHEIPYYQPKAALAFFNRTINGFDVATGKTKITPDYETHGKASATHTEPFVPLPSSTSSSSSSSSTSATDDIVPVVERPFGHGRRQQYYREF